MKNPVPSPRMDPLSIDAAGGVGTKLSVEWRQDRMLRTMAVTGALRSGDDSHLASGLIQLGNRGLVIDLRGIAAWEVDAIDSVVELVARLGKRSGRIVVSDPNLGALLSSQLATNVEVDLAPVVSSSALVDQ